MLYIIATPIGNLKDFSPRAVEVLEKVDLIAAEDTRHSQGLLRHFNLNKPMLSLHAHNEMKSTEKVIDLLQEGKSVALLSDAGTPLISDPGQPLVAAAHAANIQVIPIPGPCAAITALSAAGFANNEFTFIGFLPAKSSQRKTILETLQNETRTLIFYEAPHRIVDMLDDMFAVLGAERRICFARELTKVFETVRVMPLGELVEWVKSDKNQQLGEYVVIVEGAAAVEKAVSFEQEKVLRLLLAELPVKKAAQIASEITGVSKNALYDLALGMKK